MWLSEIGLLQDYVSKNCEIDNLGPLDSSLPNCLTFAEKDFQINRAIRNPNVAAIIISQNHKCFIDEYPSICWIVHPDPRMLFFKIHNVLVKSTDFYNFGSKLPQISAKALIDSTAYISKIGVVIEDDVIIEPKAVILDNVTIRRGSIIRAGAVIGSEGFQHIRESNNILTVLHAGRVEIGHEVEIGYSSCIDKGLYRETTLIQDQTKIHNLVQIGHSVQIGKGTLIASNVVIAGRAVIGDHAWIGPSACISNRVTIGDHSNIHLGSVVISNVKAGEHVSGNYAIPHHKFLNFMKSIL